MAAALLFLRQPNLLLAFAYNYLVGILIKWDSQGKSGF